MSKKVTTAKSAKVVKPGQAVGGPPTYEITCGKCDCTFTAQIPLHPAYRKATCPSCKTENKLS
jgi:hypothetical protein